VIEQDGHTYMGYVIIKENSRGLWARFTEKGLSKTNPLPVKVQYDGRQALTSNCQNTLIIKNEPGNSKNMWAKLKQDGDSTMLFLTPVW